MYTCLRLCLEMSKFRDDFGTVEQLKVLLSCHLWCKVLMKN